MKMSREIKFRAWDERKKIMHYDFQWMQSGNDGNDWVVFKSDKQPIMSDAVKNPFFSQQLKKMQFTGLKDKNGKEIYEGDILKLKHRGIAIQIRWSDEGSAFCIFRMDGKPMGYILSEFDYRAAEVIGNIYENSGIAE